tara:strand:- start:619 stop:3087 length:2469 start_codon:yes stop_codon:yes gene_type:complete
MIKSPLIISFTLLAYFLMGAENNLYVTQTFFEGEKVKIFNENRGSAVVMLENGELYLMNKQLEFTDITSSFDPEVLLDITCIESVNEHTFYLGTATHSLFLYEDGNVIALTELNPELPLQINSVDFYAGNIWYDGKVLLATGGTTYISSDLKTFQEFEYTSNPTNVTLLDSRNKAILPDGENRCSGISSNYLGLYSQHSSAVGFPIAENDTLDFERLNDFAVLRSFGGSFPFGYFACYATDFGIYAQHMSSCSDHFILHFDNTEVHDLEIVAGQGLLRNSMFAASDSGLLWLEFESYANVSNPEYFLFDAIDSAYIVDYSRFHNHLWVGTNDGLKIITDDLLKRESFTPEPFEFDTLDFCATEGYSFSVSLNDQLDIQWYRDGTPIEGAISTVIHSDIPGHYSVIYNEYENDTLDVAYLRLDSTFNMFLLNQEYKICPGENKPILRAINGYDGDHEYRWFSVERGLESDWNNPYHTAENGGNYYFTATNCNEYTYVSDTVFVHESPLTQPYFDYQDRPTLCEGDTLFASGIEQAVTFQWRVEHQEIENHNKPYFIPTSEESGDDIYLTIYDEYECSLSTATTIGHVYKTPILSEEDLTQFICSSMDQVGLWLPDEYGAEFDWEGEKNGSLNPVGVGIYPITVTNGVCPDFTGEVDVRLFDPFPAYKEVIYVLIGDTLKIPIDPSQPPGFWNSTVKIDDTESFLYVTSDQEDILFPSITYSQQCFLELHFEVRFVDEILGVEHQENIKIYPNPAVDYIIIENKNQAINAMSLLDLQGKQHMETRIDSSGKSLIPLPNSLKKGTYLINLFQINGNVQTRKILIE